MKYGYLQMFVKLFLTNVYVYNYILSDTLNNIHIYLYISIINIIIIYLYCVYILYFSLIHISLILCL